MISLALALGCGAVGGFLAWHYPIAPVAALVAFLAAMATSFLRPRLWLVLLA